MGGDLNTKKSWHPAIRRNQEKVWKEEKNALEERKQIEKLRKEREEEAALENLRKLQEASGGKVVQKRVDWMYSGPSGDGAGVTEEREGYLLGKRRIDHLLKTDDSTTKSLSKNAAASIDTIGSGTAGTARDVQSKIAQDPMLQIKKQMMEMQMKQLKEAQRNAKHEEKRAKEKEREKKHRHKHSRRDRSPSRDRYRSRSPRRRHRDERRERSYSKDRYRSRSPYRKHRRDRDDRSPSRERRRSRSPRRKHRDDRVDRRERSYSEDRYRSRTPPRKSRDDRSNRSDSKERRLSPPPRRDYQNGGHRNPYRDGYRSSFSGQRNAVPQPEEDTRSPSPKRDKLAEMQANADLLEQQRIERVKLREAQDAAEEEERKRKMQNGGKHISGGMRLQAAERRWGS